MKMLMLFKIRMACMRKLILAVHPLVILIRKIGMACAILEKRVSPTLFWLMILTQFPYSESPSPNSRKAAADRIKALPLNITETGIPSCVGAWPALLSIYVQDDDLGDGPSRETFSADFLEAKKASRRKRRGHGKELRTYPCTNGSPSCTLPASATFRIRITPQSVPLCTDHSSPDHSCNPYAGRFEIHHHHHLLYCS